MSATKLTVGIPTFNRAEWLSAAIESVLAQTYTSLRLIVSDNASTDATPDVVRSFNDERIDYLRCERNIGSIANFNRLIALAQTEYLVLLSDDDVLYPGHLEAAVELLECSESVGLVHTAFDFIDAQSRVIQRVNPMRTRSPAMIQTRDHALEWMMTSRWGPCFPSVVYRTKAIVEADGLREGDEPFGDRKLWMRIALNWEFGYLAKPLAAFRTHPNAMQTNIGIQRGATSDAERIRLFSQINFQRRMEFLDDAPLEPQRTKRLRALATLQLLVENASSGISWNDAATRAANVLRTYPRILLRPALWRLVVAQLGGRRLRSALHRRLGAGESGGHPTVDSAEGLP